MIVITGSGVRIPQPAPGIKDEGGGNRAGAIRFDLSAIGGRNVVSAMHLELISIDTDTVPLIAAASKA
jgi:hypothetical protein